MERNQLIGPIRFSEDEKRNIEQAAEKRGHTLASWIRWCAVEASRQLLERKGK